jgi:hypothetical protein
MGVLRRQGTVRPDLWDWSYIVFGTFFIPAWGCEHIQFGSFDVVEMATNPASVVQIIRLPEGFDLTDTLHVPWLSSTPRRIYHLEESCQGKYLVFFGLASSSPHSVVHAPWGFLASPLACSGTAVSTPSSQVSSMLTAWRRTCSMWLQTSPPWSRWI